MFVSQSSSSVGNSSQTEHLQGIGDAIFDHGILMTYFAFLVADSSFFPIAYMIFPISIQNVRVTEAYVT